MIETLLARFHQRDRTALARLVTLVARGESVEAILDGVGPPKKPSRVVAITGSGGVGKSTLVGKLIEQARTGGQSVAVLACDPQSPLSGGALLGDRFRMPSRPDDDGVFIRSLAAAGGQGALAEHLDGVIRLVESFGFDLILLETVGAGQGDTVVRDLVDLLVLLLQPETGDDLQWEKAGLFEVADLLVIHKADLPGAERVEGQVKMSLGLTPGLDVPVLLVSSRTGAGLPELFGAIEAAPLRRGTHRPARELLRLAQQVLARRFLERQSGAEAGAILGRWQRGEVDTPTAAAALLRCLAGEPTAPEEPTWPATSPAPAASATR
jgi:LAO/AO transport system ATPase